MLGEEYTFCMLENKVQREIFGAEKDERGDKFRLLDYEVLWAG